MRVLRRVHEPGDAGQTRRADLRSRASALEPELREVGRQRRAAHDVRALGCPRRGRRRRGSPRPRCTSCARPASSRRRGRRSRSSSDRRRRAGAACRRTAGSARSRSPTASSASTSSQVSAPVTHGLVSTHLMPRPGTTKSSQRLLEQPASRGSRGPRRRGRGSTSPSRTCDLSRNRSRCSRSAWPSRPPASSHSGCGSSISSESATPGAQGLVDAGRAGEQRLRVHRRRAAVGPLLRPGDAAERQLHRRPPSRGRGARPASGGVRTRRRGGPASGARRRPRGTPTCWSRRCGPRPRRRRSSSATSRRRAACRGTSRNARSDASTWPPTSSAIADSTWFQTSVCSPTVHGTAPSGSCMAAIDAGGLLDLRRRQHAVHAGTRAGCQAASAPARACGSRAPCSCRSAG